jgi:hypothetical protein
LAAGAGVGAGVASGVGHAEEQSVENAGLQSDSWHHSSEIPAFMEWHAHEEAVSSGVD